jgi:hypothetical protein
MKQTMKPLNGSWRNFTAKLDPSTADLFRRINAKTLENLNAASKASKIKVVRVKELAK